MAQWSADGDDLTVPEGAMAQPSLDGVKDKARCTVDGCVARMGHRGHAKAFKHVPSPNRVKPKPKGGPMVKVAKAMKAKREKRQAFIASKWTTLDRSLWLQASMPGKPLKVLTGAPYAWALDKKGMPKALEA